MANPAVAPLASLPPTRSGSSSRTDPAEPTHKPVKRSGTGPERALEHEGRPRYADFSNLGQGTHGIGPRTGRKPRIFRRRTGLEKPRAMKLD